MAHMYIRVWEYDVDPHHVDEFVAAYGSDGDWADLFRRGRGYLGTALYRGTEQAEHFITVDQWTDGAAWSAFLQLWGDTYERLDSTMNGLSLAQRGLLEGEAGGRM